MGVIWKERNITQVYEGRNGIIEQEVFVKWDGGCNIRVGEGS